MKKNKIECNHRITNFRPIMAGDSARAVKEIKCIECDSVIGWWHIATKKIAPIRRSWTKEECLTLR
jgi:hypothetical protein